MDLNGVPDDNGDSGEIFPEPCQCDQCKGESQHGDTDSEDESNDADMEIGENTSIPSTSTTAHHLGTRSTPLSPGNQIFSNENNKTLSHTLYPLNYLPEEYYELSLNKVTNTYGSALIINMDFANTSVQKFRTGSSNDVTSLKKMFPFLKIHIYDVLENITADNLMDAISGFKRHLQKTNAGCLFFVIMTHGVQNFIITHDNIRVNIYEKILAKFSEQQFEDFAEKPKVFIFNACQNARKENTNVGFSLKLPNRDRLTNALIVTPCSPGQSAKRSKKRGSYLIQTMEKVFTIYAKHAHLEQMLNMIQQHMQNKPVGDGKTEINIPNYYPLVFKRFMFPAIEQESGP